jgi:hypothetical protein
MSLDTMQQIGMLLNNTYSEEWRLECEAKYVLSIPKNERKAYLITIEDKRGKEAREKLEKEILRIWNKKK